MRNIRYRAVLRVNGDRQRSAANRCCFSPMPSGQQRYRPSPLRRYVLISTSGYHRDQTNVEQDATLTRVRCLPPASRGAYSSVRIPPSLPAIGYKKHAGRSHEPAMLCSFLFTKRHGQAALASRGKNAHPSYRAVMVRRTIFGKRRFCLLLTVIQQNGPSTHHGLPG